MISFSEVFMPKRTDVQVNVGSPAGSYASSSTPFFHYVVRLSEAELSLYEEERRLLEMLGAIPHAFFDGDSFQGPGWKVIPPRSLEDWPVLETDPARLRQALQTAIGVIWGNAAKVGITAREIGLVEEEVEKVLHVVDQAERAGFKINMTYVS